MRLWSIHPKYLDAKGLTALWREALLAKAVLGGQTKGYRHHPQLERFRAHAAPRRAINAYLWHVLQEAKRRGYSFDSRKARRPGRVAVIRVNQGQVDHEAVHLLAKLERRDQDRWTAFHSLDQWELHPLMRRRGGGIEAWERY